MRHSFRIGVMTAGLALAACAVEEWPEEERASAAEALGADSVPVTWHATAHLWHEHWTGPGDDGGGDIDIGVIFERTASGWEIHVDNFAVQSVSLQPGTRATGQVNGTAATLTVPIHEAGHNLDFTLQLSTDGTIKPPGSPILAGKRLDDQLNLTMVGTGTADLAGTVTFYAMLTGPFSTWPALEMVHQDLGWGALDGPGALARGNRLDVFWRGTDGKIYSSWYDGTYPWWSAPQNLGWASTSSPGVVARGNRLDVFWRGVDGKIYSSWYDGTYPWWSAPQNLGWASISAPVAVARGNRLDVFWRGTNGTIFGSWYDGTYPWWSSPQAFGWAASSAPSAVARGNRLDVFWRGTDGAIYSSWYDGTYPWWSSPQNLGWQARSAPAVVARGNRLDAFWRGPSNRVQRSWYDGTFPWWSVPEDLGGDDATDLAAVAVGGQETAVFYTSSAGHVTELHRAAAP
jgi:hypothetical protein